MDEKEQEFDLTCWLAEMQSLHLMKTEKAE